MSGEDPWDPGSVCWDFRVKCHTCGKQVQLVGGQRVIPDCGHELPALEIDCGESDE